MFRRSVSMPSGRINRCTASARVASGTFGYRFFKNAASVSAKNHLPVIAAPHIPAEPMHVAVQLRWRSIVTSSKSLSVWGMGLLGSGCRACWQERENDLTPRTHFAVGAGDEIGLGDVVRSRCTALGVRCAYGFGQSRGVRSGMRATSTKSGRSPKASTTSRWRLCVSEFLRSRKTSSDMAPGHPLLLLANKRDLIAQAVHQPPARIADEGHHIAA